MDRDLAVFQLGVVGEIVSILIGIGETECFRCIIPLLLVAVLSVFPVLGVKFFEISVLTLSLQNDRTESQIPDCMRKNDTRFGTYSARRLILDMAAGRKSGTLQVVLLTHMHRERHSEAKSYPQKLQEKDMSR